MQHQWVKSKVGHGILQCSVCFITILEAEAIGKLYKCEPIEKKT